MGWFEDTFGIGAGDALNIAGHIVDWWDRSEAIEGNELVGSFNRQLDLLNLGMNNRHLGYDIHINQLLAQQNLNEIAQVQNQVGYWRTENEFIKQQRAHGQWLMGSKLRELDLVAERELDTAWAQVNLAAQSNYSRQRILQQKGINLRHRRFAADMERDAEWAMTGVERTEAYGAHGRAGRQFQARMGTLQAAQAVGRAGEQVVEAGRRRVGAERAATGRLGAMRRTERVEQAQREIGAGRVSGAARGMAGSFRITTEMRARTEAARDLERFSIEDGLRQLQLGEESARLGAEEARLGAEAAGVREQMVGAKTAFEAAGADLRLALGRTDTAQARLMAGKIRADAAFDLEQFEYDEQAYVNNVEQYLHSMQFRGIEGQREFLDDRRERITREGGIDFQQRNLQLLGNEVRIGQADIDVSRLGIDSLERTYNVWLGQIAQGINQWQLQELPNLPNYEGMGTRNALAFLLNAGATLID